MELRVKGLVPRVFKPRGTAMFLGLSLLVGVLVGAGAALLIFSIGWVERGFEAFGDALSLGRYLVLGSVPLVFLAAWWIAGRFAPEVGGDGVPETAAALTVRAGYLPSRTAPLKILATAITLGGGGSAGREGPIVQIGGAIGSSLARYSRLGEDQIRSLVAAGAGAAIGASFNAPIAGMLFAMEVILGHFAVRHLNAVVVASVAAAVTSRSLVGEERILQAFPYRVVDARELLLYALLGVLVVGVAYVFLRVLNRTDTTQDSRRWPSWVRPVALGLAVAALGVAEPRILRTGQEFVGELLQISAGGIEVWWVLFLLAGVKILATAGTIGSGASGGAFMPSLFIGATLGAGFAQLLDPVWNFSELQPGAFAVVGMAATFAAVARAPLTAIIIVFEITGDYALVLALMLAAALATFGIDRIHPDSVYTMPLARRGIRLTRTSEVDLLDTVTVGEVMSGNPTLITPTMTTGEVQGTLDRHRHHGLSVVDDRGRLIGIITVTDILRSGGPSDHVTAADAMTPHPVTAWPGTPVSVALERMVALGAGRLPVVANDDPDRLVGMFRREDAVRAYHHALSTSTQHELTRQRLRTRTQPGADFVDFEIPVGSVADGRPLKEVPWPEDFTLVSVRRGRTVLVPKGDTVLRRGDVVTAFTSPEARSRLAERLRTTAEQPTVDRPTAGDGRDSEE